MFAVVTSISPSHKNSDIQVHAMNSWLELGYHVYSFNCLSEAHSLSKKYAGVTFIPTHRTNEHQWGKPLVSINAMVDWAKDNSAIYDGIILVNSDILVDDSHNQLPRLIKKSEFGLEFFNRWNYTSDQTNAKVYSYGFDCFIIHKKFYSLIPQTNFCLGQCVFDYAIPYWFLKNDKLIFNEGFKIFLHKEHSNQYSPKDWEWMIYYFQFIENFHCTTIVKAPQIINNMIFSIIQEGIQAGKRFSL